MAAKVLEACPDSQWKLLFCARQIWRRANTERALGLRWGDIHWAENRMTVHSPKTEHHEGKDSRVVPIFPELRPYLDAVWDEAPEEAEFVITRYRDANSNLRTQLERIIRKAGLEPWPKLFQNLQKHPRDRASRDVSDSRLLCLARQQPSSGEEALPAGDRRAFQKPSRR